MSDTLKAHIALSTVALLYGANYVIAKVTLGSGFLSPQGFIMMRVASTAVLLWVFHSIFIKEKVSKSDLPYLAMCSVFGVMINQLFFFQGLKHTSAMHASLIMISTPILVLVGSIFILRSKVTWRQVAGILFGLLGAALLIWSAGNGDEASSVKGDLYILLNATSYALYLLLAKKVLDKYHAITVVKWLFTFGFFLIIPFGLMDMLQAEYHNFESKHWWSVAFVLIGATFMTYTLNAFALSKIKPSTVSFYIYFQPLVASVVAISIGNDQLDATKLQSALFLFLGVYLVTSSRRQKAKNFRKVT